MLGIALGIVGLAAMLMVTGTGKFLGKAFVEKYYPNSYYKKSIEEEFSVTAKQLSKKLPQRTDEITTWKSVMSFGPLLTFSYIVDSSKIETDRTVFLSRMNKNLKKIVCTPKSMIKDGGRYKYSYEGEDGTAIGSVEIGKVECELNAVSSSLEWVDALQKGDFAVALSALKPLAEDGNADAQSNLAVMYVKGHGVAQDYKAAVKWYTLAAEQGYTSAQNGLGTRYKNGEGVAQDYKAAVKWYTLAAEQGHAPAQYNLGVIYYIGRGVLQDYKAAVKWLTLAAEQGHIDASYNLGVMYFDGDGVVQDHSTAFKWYKIAAKQGKASAQYQLGLMYAKGHGVDLNYSAGYMWSSISVANGDKNAADVRDLLVELMELYGLDIAQPQRLARECVKRNYKECDWHESGN